MNKFMYILFVCLTSRKDAKGNAPIVCRITINGQRAEFRTGKNVNPQNWEKKKQIVKPKEANSQMINLYLSELRNNLVKTHMSCQEENYCTAQYIKDSFLNLKNQKKPIFQIIDLFLDKQKMLIDKPKKTGGIKQNTFNATFKKCEHFKTFLTLNKQENCYPSFIDNQLLNTYNTYLIQVKNFDNDYLIKCLQIVKTIMNYTVEIQEISTNPIHFFKIPQKKTSELIFLTQKEKEKFEDYSFTAVKLQQVQDLFLFQSYTGFAYVDLYAFSEKHIFQNDEILFIKMKRTKTDQEAIIPFFPQARAIWKKYNKELPKISNQNYNAYLKEIAGVLGIDKILTTHVARRTFATLALNAGISIEVVSRCLGHSDIKITQKLYAKINENRILREFDNIEF